MDRPYITTAATPGPYRAMAERLRESAARYDLEVHIGTLVPQATHLDTRRTKSRYLGWLRGRPELRGRPLMWVDADAAIERDPREAFDRLEEDFDVAAHVLRGRELLGGTLIFMDRPIVRAVLKLWDELHRSEPTRLEQRNLQKALERIEGARLRVLGPAWTWIDDISGIYYEGIDPLIRHHQASRRTDATHPRSRHRQR